MPAVDELTKTQIDRILGSDVFDSADGLRRLLNFLAEKSLSGEANELKEYSIGIDAFGKPSTYDPRHDSTVRIQVGRLRQKLAEYYQKDGKDDPIVVTLPKGKYRLNWQPRQPVEPGATMAASPEVRAEAAGLRAALMAVSLCLLALVAWTIYSGVSLKAERRSTALFLSQWTPEIASVWARFVDSEHPLLISIGTPLFVDLPGIGFLRDPAVNSPEQIGKSPGIAALGKALRISAVEPSIDFSTYGAANSVFLLTRILAPRKANVSTMRGEELSWAQVSQNNVVLIGSPEFFKLPLTGMPVKEELVMDSGGGIRNLEPRAGEPAVFEDQRTRLSGTAYALVSLTPGPLGNTDVMSFFTRAGAGITGAVAWFTEPASARSLLAKLRNRSGEIPRYYQVLLRVRFQDGVPLETSYVLHRELHATIR